MYVDIVMSNVFNLKNHFFFSFRVPDCYECRTPTVTSVGPTLGKCRFVSRHHCSNLVQGRPEVAGRANSVPYITRMVRMLGI